MRRRATPSGRRRRLDRARRVLRRGVRLLARGARRRARLCGDRRASRSPTWSAGSSRTGSSCPRSPSRWSFRRSATRASSGCSQRSARAASSSCSRSSTPRVSGMGDVKLAAFLGAWLGRDVAVALFVGTLLGALPALVVLVRRGRSGRKVTLPYVPCPRRGRGRRPLLRRRAARRVARLSPRPVRPWLSDPTCPRPRGRARAPRSGDRPGERRARDPHAAVAPVVELDQVAGLGRGAGRTTSR